MGSAADHQSVHFTNHEGRTAIQAGKYIVHGDSIVQHTSDPLKQLPYAVDAPFNSNSKQREPSCLENTRLDLRREIHCWADTIDKRRIFWLSGLAGTGKSTIARTIARDYHDKKRLAASFFFSRGGGDVGHTTKFVTSIAVQLADNVPESRQHIHNAIANRRDITELGLYDQWHQIVLGPLSKLEMSSLSLSAYILVIDALDECEDKENVALIVKLLAETRLLGSLQLRVFLTSRPEVPIRHGFWDIADEEHQDFVLHNISPCTVNQDISTYFRHKLQFIARHHRLAVDWPGEEVIAQLVQNASGLFIWAATAYTFVQQGAKKQIVQDRLNAVIQRNGNITKPEEYLDDIYVKVLTASVSTTLTLQERESFFARLKYTLGSISALLSPLSISSLSTLLSQGAIIPDGDIEDVLDDLHAILVVPECQDSPLRLQHPSFREFLIDKGRCRDARFWVDEKQAHQELASNCIRLLSCSLIQNICKVDVCGALVVDLPKGVLEQYLSPELQYACLYWIQHVHNGGAQLQDNDAVHGFLLEHFLHWLEALGWMGRLAEGVNAIRVLQSTIRAEVCPHLYAFVHDMKRFTLYSRVAVEQAPLQVYYSALIFAPSRSIVKKHFFKGLPQWIKRAPEPQSQWGALTQTLEGHCSTVSAVAFSPIANVLASASWDETVKLWDVNTGTEQYTLSGHEGWVRAVAFSPDGKMVASASDDKTVKLWQVATGIEWHTFHDHSEEVAAVAYSSDGKMLASASYDMAVKIWDPSERVLLRTLQGHSDCINTLAFSPDCTLLVSGSDDEEVKLWNMCSNDAPITIQSGFGEVSSVAFSPVGDMVASASNDRKIRLWNVANNTVTQILDGHSATVSALAYSSGGKILASASFDKTVKLWDPYSGTLLQTLESHTKAVRSLSFANDIMLASSSEDRMVNIWEVDAFELWQNINSPVEEKKEVTSSTEESPDLSLNDTVALWDARQCLPFSPPKCYFEATTRVTFSPNGDFLAVILQGRSIELWNVHTKQRLHIFTDAHAMVFLSNRIVKVFLIFWQRVFTQLWDIQAGKELQKFEQTATEVAKSVTKIPRWTLSLDGEMVAVAYNSHDNANLRAMSRNNLIILLFQLDKKNTWSNFCLLPLPGKNNPYDESKNWDEMHTGNQVDTEKDDDSIYYIDSMTFSPDGKVLAATSNAGTIDLVDTQTRAHLQRFTDVMALAFSPEGKTIAVALDGGRIRILNSDSIIPLMVVESFHIGRYIHPCGQAESHGRIRSMVFSPGGGLLAINSGAAKIDLVHIRSGSRLQLFTEASALSFSPDGEILVVALESGAICVLDAHTRTQLCILKGYYKNVESMVFSPDSTILAVTFKSGDTCVLDTSSNAPLHRMTEHRKRITAIAVSPDGSVLASASDDKTIKIRAIATKDVLRTLEDHPETVCALAFSQDGLYLAAAFENAMVWIWNASIGDMRQIRNTGSRVHALAFSPDSQVVASACADKTIRLWDIASGILKSTIEAGHTADSLAFSSDGFSFQTSYGTFHMSPASAGTTIVKREPPKVRIREHWIASALGDMLWLPPEYRSRCTVVCGNIVAMGFSSGQVAIFEFAF